MYFLKRIRLIDKTIKNFSPKLRPIIKLTSYYYCLSKRVKLEYQKRYVKVDYRICNDRITFIIYFHKSCIYKKPKTIKNIDFNW